MSDKNCVAVNRYTIGSSATGITLDGMGIAWKSGVRRLVLKNGAMYNIYVSNGDFVPTTAVPAYCLYSGATPGAGNELVIHGTSSSFKKLIFNMGAGETGTLLVQQDNDTAG